MKYTVNDVNEYIEEDNIIEMKKIANTQMSILLSEYVNIFCSPLHYAIKYGSENMCRYLIDIIDVNYSSNETSTPLDVSATAGNYVITEILLQKGANVDGLETSILTPMMSALSFGHYEIVKLLVENGAYVNRMHVRNGMLPLDIAISRGYKEIEVFLRANGAKTQFDTPKWVTNEIEGNGILAYVTLQAGTILPVDVYNDSEDRFAIKLSAANNGKHRLLFTFGLNSVHDPKVELFITVPEYWNLYNSEPINQFPALLLIALAESIKGGYLISEGDYIFPSDEKFKGLRWPEYIACLYVSDVKWKSATESEDSDEVSLYSLIPVKKTKKGFTKQSLEKSRSASWDKLCIKI